VFCNRECLTKRGRFIFDEMYKAEETSFARRETAYQKKGKCEEVYNSRRNLMKQKRDEYSCITKSYYKPYNVGQVRTNVAVHMECGSKSERVLYLRLQCGGPGCILWSSAVVFNLFCSWTPRYNFSSTLYPQSCWYIMHVIHIV
jgi:hypothetical protein